MKDAALIVACVLVIYAFLSWASAPAQVLAERSKRQGAEATVSVLQTQVTVARPTRTPVYHP